MYDLIALALQTEQFARFLDKLKSTEDGKQSLTVRGADPAGAAPANIPEVRERDFWIDTFAAINVLREAAKEDAELGKNVNDCVALASLGCYYASKIRRACALALFDLDGDTFEHGAALRHPGETLAHWKQYAAIRDAQYVPALYNRLGHVDITALTENVAADLEIARGWKPGSLKDDGKRSGSEKGFRE